MAGTERASYKQIPTPEQRKQERALALVIWLDALIIVPYATVGLAAGSLAIIAEVLRGGLLLLMVGASLHTLRRSHRGVIGGYDYGMGKVERALSCGVAVLLLFAMGFIIWRALVMKPHAVSSPMLAGLAILFTCLNLAVNTILSFLFGDRCVADPSVIVFSHFRPRLAKALGSVVVVASITIHAVASQPETGQIAEDVGAVVVIGFMIVVAVGLLREALPDLLDRAITEPMQMQVNRTLAAFFHDFDELIRCATRRAGNIAHVEITLAFPP